MARSPEYPQRIRVASVFEPFDCLFFVCLLGSKFPHFLLIVQGVVVQGVVVQGVVVQGVVVQGVVVQGLVVQYGAGCDLLVLFSFSTFREHRFWEHHF